MANEGSIVIPEAILRNATHVVFEKGVEIGQDEQGKWLFASVQGEQTSIEPSKVVQYFGIRPILVTVAGYVASAGKHTLLLSITDGETLDKRIMNFTQVAFAKRPGLMSHIFNLAYVIGAVCHHCKSLTMLYADTCRVFASYPEIWKTDEVGFRRDSPAYYELDALLTSVLRAYNMLRYPIWNALGSSVSYPQPRSFEKLLTLLTECQGLSKPLIDRLSASWSKYGCRVKEYRDCIQHYVPIEGALPVAQMTKLHDLVWSASIWLPDNPEVRSQRQFRYDGQVDALTFGWEVTNEVVEVAEAILNELPDKAS